MIREVNTCFIGLRQGVQTPLRYELDNKEIVPRFKIQNILICKNKM